MPITWGSLALNVREYSRPSTPNLFTEKNLIPSPAYNAIDELHTGESYSEIQLDHYPVILDSEEVRSAPDGGGVLLDNGTDYTLDNSTGVITPISWGSGAVYCTYQYPNYNPQTTLMGGGRGRKRINIRGYSTVAEFQSMEVDKYSFTARAVSMTGIESGMSLTKAIIESLEMTMQKGMSDHVEYNLTFLEVT